MARNYFNYFTEIEEYFVRKRGKNLLISPMDWCLIEVWKDSGVPLHVALRGIDRSFDVSSQRRKSAPRTLFYCHPTVMEAFEEYQDATVGSRDESAEDPEQSDSQILEKDSVCAFLEEIREVLESRSGEPYERALKRISALLLESKARTNLVLEKVDREVSQVLSLLVEELASGMDPDTLESLKAESREELKTYRKRISKEMFSRLKEKNLERKLREHFVLPEFSLLGR